MSPQFTSFAGSGSRLSLAFALLLVASLPGGMLGQGPRFSAPIAAGSELERYLRANDLLDSASRRHWTVRPAGGNEAGSFRFAAGHPWRAQFPDSFPITRTGLTNPAISLIENSAFAYGFNDGPVWAGKGVTLAGTAGIELVRPHLAITLAPIAFIAQNADFAIGDNGQSGDRRFGDLLRPDAIDAPQRFGDKTYAAVNPGESEIAVRGFGLTGGLSSRSQVWGPAYEHPMILGNNAGGIPRLFAGTQAPLDLRWIAIHGQVFWGQVNESAYGPDTGAARRHFVTAAVGSVAFRNVPGLELGLIRFFHTSWPASGTMHVPWLRVLQGFLSADPTVGENPDNQLASGFIRIAPPGRGFEVYGEFGREDRGEEFRDLLLEPDHDAGYMVGFARTWAKPDASRMTVLRGEVLNTRLSHLQQQRPQTPWYMHVAQSQGHTERGQILGSAGGFGGGASNLTYDRYSSAGRMTVRWDRIVRGTPRSSDGLPIPDQVDVTHAIGVERALFTKHGQLTVGVALVKNFNRYFSADATNANVSVGYRLLR